MNTQIGYAIVDQDDNILWMYVNGMQLPRIYPNFEIANHKQKNNFPSCKVVKIAMMETE